LQSWRGPPLRPALRGGRPWIHAGARMTVVGGRRGSDALSQPRLPVILAKRESTLRHFTARRPAVDPR
jgi:hypothetical protein